MYLAYVDESGDSGLKNSPTPYFVLSALVVHESDWGVLLEDTVAFRRKLKKVYGLKLRHEIHAAEFFYGSKGLDHIKKHERLQICKRVIDFQENLDYISLVNVVVNKSNKPEGYDVFENAWKILLQRIHNTIFYNNFPSGFSNEDNRFEEKALIVPDKTDDKKLKMLSRKMRRFNPVPYEAGKEYRQLLIDTIIEDPYSKDSADSFFHQLVDVNAYFLYQSINPKKYIKKKKGHNFFNRFNKALCKVASRKDRNGIVRL